MKAAHGLVIGKFYPPHAGHHLLVRAAADTCQRVTVVVMGSTLESIPLFRRVAWLREVHADQPHVRIVGELDDYPVDYNDPDIWDAHEQVMRDGLAQMTTEPVDAVFTSEPYGAELARRFGARHALIDLSRAMAPVSGTAVRRDVVGHWDFLEPPVRGGLARRVVLVGAESTGKSTLAQELAEALARRGGAHALTRWVPEYGRAYTARKIAAAVAEAALEGKPPPSMPDLVWTSGDFEEVARVQAELEDTAACAGGPVLIADTDVFTTALWHERYMRSRSAVVEAWAAERRPALYLLTHHDDVPFIQDGLRDGDAIRAWMTGRFEELLKADGRPFIALRGGRAERRDQALAAIDDLLQAGWGLADPIEPR